MFRKILTLSLVTMLSMVLFACGNDDKDTTPTVTEGTTETTEPGITDSIPPAFTGAVLGELEGVSHLKGAEIVILEGVAARDNKTADANITITISDYDGYDKDVPGVYTIVIQAEDEAGNKSTVNKVITVLETIERTLDAIVIGDKFTEYVYNNTNALEYTTSGTSFRTSEKVQVMTKQFFIDEYNENKDAHGYNGNVPYFPNGVIVITDTNMNVKLIRVAVGITVEVGADGVLTTEGLTWTNGLDATNGGGNFKGILEALETAIPDGGYIMFTGNAAPETGRKFLVSNFFYSGYTGGAVSVEQFDATVSTLSIELVEDFTEVIAVPAKISTPVIGINRHVLSWDAVTNAASYEIYVDGVLVGTQTTTSLAMSTLDLALTADGSDGYAVTVKALTKDMFQWSTSDLSEAVLYKQIVIQDLAAPVLTADGTTVTWTLVDGADSYDVYINFAGKDVLVGNTELGTYDLSSYNDVYAGLTNVYVKAIGDNDHYDSLNSVSVEILLGEIKSLTMGVYTVDVIETTAYNYFTRRNTDYNVNNTGFANAPYLFLITDINNIKNIDFGATATEAFGTVVLLDSAGKPKLINNILAKQTWKVGEGWITDETYASNGAQLSNMGDAIIEGDMLLIGKNGTTLTLENIDGTTATAKARDFVAYFYINPWGTFPGAGTEGWRSFPNFIDPTNVTYVITTKE